MALRLAHLAIVAGLLWLAAPAPAGAQQVLSGSYVGDGTDNRAITGLGFQPDVVIVKGVDTSVSAIRTATMGADQAKDLTGATALEADHIQSLDATGFTVGTHAQVNGTGVTYHWVAFKAAAGTLKAGSYRGNGTAERAVTGVGFSPELVFVLAASNDEAVFRAASSTETYNFAANAGMAHIASLDADGFTVGSDARVNGNGVAYNCVAWNAVAGTQVVSSYTSNATDSRSITGVGFAPEWVMVKSFEGDDAVQSVNLTGCPG